MIDGVELTPKDVNLALPAPFATLEEERLHRKQKLAGALRIFGRVGFGEGNYNSSTSRVYTDLGLLTCREDIASDVSDIFNFLTGFSNPKFYRNLVIDAADMAVIAARWGEICP